MFEGLCTVLFAIRDSCCLFYPIISYSPSLSCLHSISLLLPHNGIGQVSQSLLTLEFSILNYTYLYILAKMFCGRMCSTGSFHTSIGIRGEVCRPLHKS